ncbi:MAG: helix-turn-helix domain-containing protein [Clostridia bacterium]|nr:helix-turn-helix domain-containing protein [Clostridia bacterium]
MANDIDINNEHKERKPSSGRHHPVAESKGEYAKKIRAYRLGVGINQPELAKTVGVTKNAVSNWEAGRTRPDLDSVKKLCMLFGISADDFLGIPQVKKTITVKRITKSGYTASQERFLDRLLALPEKERDYICALLESMEKHNPKEVALVPTYDSEEAFDADWVEGFAYYYSACAGEGSDIPEDDQGESIYLRRSATTKDFDCVIPIDGDSMEPLYHSGDRVLVKRTDSLNYGDTAIVFVNDVCMIKEYTPKGLRPINDKKYGLVRISEGTSVKLVGKVVGILTDDMLPTDEEKRSIELFLEEHA